MLVMVVGLFLKICLVIFAIICSPLLFVFGVVFVALLLLRNGGHLAVGQLISMFPTFNVVLPASPLSAIVILLVSVVGIPLSKRLVWMIFSQIFKWQPYSFRPEMDVGHSLDCKCGVFGICFTNAGSDVRW